MAIISNEDGNSTLTGTAGDDTVVLSPPVAPLTGQAFFPTFGSNDNDLIQTGDGDDLIRFGPGIDTIDGGAGQDSVLVSFFSAAEHGLGGVPLGGGSTGFTVYGFSVTSLLVDLGAETYQLNTVGSLQFQPSISRVFSGTIRNVEVLEGTFGNDTLRGSDREDAVEVFRTSSGVDVLDGRGGRDRLELPQNAPSGVWTIDLALGRLLRDGGVVATLAGIEDVAGSFGADLIIGTDAANEIAGYAGNDTILAGDGDDRIIMDFGFDDITLGEGADVLDLTASARGTIRDFTFLVDRFELPDIPPSAARRAGVTRAEEDGPPALRLEDAGAGSADLLVRHGNRTYATLSDGITRLSTGIMQAVDDAATTAFGARSSGGAAGGGNRGDIVTGLAAGNRLSGAGGSDTLFGFGGIDIVTGGPGNDTLFGGDGDDELISGGGSDVMFGGAGSDLLVVRRSRPTDVNIFDGGSGADQYFGGTGRDTYVISDQTGPGGFPDFVRIFGPGDKIDLSEFDLTRRERNPEEWRFAWRTEDGSRDHVFHVFLPGNESARLTDADFMVLLGDGLPIRESFAAKLAFLHRPGNYIHRDGAVNAQEGTNRADRLAGRRGDDALDGRGGADVIAGKAGDDFLQGQAGADVIRGGAGKDRLFGGDGSDTLYGQAGKDTLSGGLGSDELIGGAGIDVFLLSYEDVQFQNGADTIIGFVLGEDRIELDQGLDPEGFRVRAEEDRIRFYLNEQTYEDYRHFLTVLVENATERILTLDDII